MPARLQDVLRTQPPVRRTPVWLAAAASLVLGVVATLWWQSASHPPMRLTGESLAAKGALAEALAHRLSTDPASEGIEVGLSFRARDGAYCRSFVLGAQSLGGLACRRADGWQVVALGAARQAQGGGLRQAGSPLPPAVLAEVDARLQGEPLDAAGERRARDSGWR